MVYKPIPKTAVPANTAIQYNCRKSLGTVCDCACVPVCREAFFFPVAWFDKLLGSGCSLCVFYMFGKWRDQLGQSRHMAWLTHSRLVLSAQRGSQFCRTHQLYSDVLAMMCPWNVRRLFKSPWFDSLSLSHLPFCVTCLVITLNVLSMCITTSFNWKKLHDLMWKAITFIAPFCDNIKSTVVHVD